MIIGVPKEVKEGEYRVALPPSAVSVLVEDGHQVWVEEGAGRGCGFTDGDYLQVGAKIIPDHADDRRERLLQRDRIITALSDFFFAVECSEDSGAVDAAKRAKIQGKRVLAVDWSKIKTTWHKPKNGGAQQLIQEGIAETFPRRQVSDIRDPRLLEEFDELLTGAA